MIASTVSTPLEGGEAGHSPSAQPEVTTPNSIDEQTTTPNTKEPSLQSDTTTVNQDIDDSASVVSTPKSFITKPIQTPIGTEVFLITAYKQLLDNKSTKRNPELLKLTNEALKLCQTQGFTRELALRKENTEIILAPFLMACSSTSQTNTTIALDCLGKMISFNYLPTTEPNRNLEATVNTDQATSTDGNNKDRTPIERVVMAICACFVGEYTDDRIQTQVIKALLTAVSSPSIVLHQEALLNAIRTLYNIFLLSRDTSRQTVAQGTLIQMVHSVFGRVIKTGDKEATLSSSPTTLKSNGDNEPIEVDIKESEQSINGSKLTLEAMSNENVTNSFNTNGSESICDTKSDLNVLDAYLLFRALCKLSIKPYQVSGTSDVRSISMRSKLLSLYLILNILNEHTEVFLTSKVIFISNNEHKLHKTREVSFLTAVKPYLCLCLSRNLASEIPKVFEMTLSVFEKVVVGLRHNMKNEIEVFLKEIILPILEMKNFPPSKHSLLSIFVIKICSNPQILVELYLNYDCDRESLNNNLYERLVGAISKISTSCKPHEELEIYETFMKFYSNEPLMQKQMGFNEFITDTIDADMLIKNPPLTSDKINSTYMVSSFYPEYEFTEPLLQIRALSCLVNLLKSMVQWSHKSIIEIEGPAAVEDSEDSSCRDTVVSTETPSETPTASAENIGSTKLNPTSDDPDQFEQIQYEKQALRKCVELFNQKPKRGIKKLIENNFIPNDSPLEIAKFLLQSEDLDKVMIGEYLGEGEAQNITIMHHFVDLLEFTNLDFVSALRKFLRTFRLPGEAQKIDRFMLKFAERYVEGNPGVFANADTAYVLGYSVILLNTDLHNPQIKRRMTKDDFIKNNRGINDNGDLPNELLEEIYDEIQKNEIKMKDEPAPQQNQEATPATGLGQFDLLGNRQKKESAMNRALQKSSQIEKYLKQLLSHKGQREDANGMSIFYTASHWQHIRPMFELVWMACLAGVSGPIQKCNHPRVVKLCLNGFRCAVRISGIFDISLARNAFITALCNFCFLTNISEMKSKNLEAIKVTLEIAGNDGNYLKDSWNDVLSVVNNLVRLQIVPNYNATDGTLSEKTRRASSSSTPSFALTHNANLASTDRPRATGAQVSEATMETTNSQQTLIAIDKIFSNSVNLSGSAIVDFLDALCVIAISGIQSLPKSGNIGKTLLNSRMFALQKVVEIAYYNMNRIRIEWLNIWNVLGNLFNQAGCHPSETVSSFALDSLRQLSMNFLEKDELPRFRFQKEFLKPFAYIIANNKDNSIKDLVLRCLQQMIKTHGENVKSGWITMMEVFSIASKDSSEEIYKFSFELMQELFEASYVNVSNLPGSFSSYLATLAAFANYTKSQKLSLSSMDLYKGIVDEYISLTVQEPNNPALSTYAIGIDKVAGKVWLEDYPYYAFWIPVFEGYLEVILNAKDIEVRTRAIDQLFQYLQNQGQEFPGGFWYYLMQEVLMKMFGDVNAQSKQHGIHSFSKEELDMWVSTTLVEALRRFVALFTDYFDSLFPFIDGLLDLLAACLCQEDTTLSKLGASCFQQLVENNVHKLNHEHWEKLISIVIRLFNASRLDIPIPQSDLTLSLTGCNADDISDLERRIIDDSIPIPLSPKNDQHRQSLCLLMLSLIEDLFLQHDLVFDNVDPNYLFIILSGVESTYHQTQIVNGQFDLKDAVNRDALYEITKFAKTSLNQELSCISSLMKILLRMYDSDNEIYKRFHNKVEERLIPLFKDTFREFNQISNYPLTKATQQVYDVWHNVVLRVGNFLCKAKDSNFKIIFAPISEEAILSLKHRHLTDDIKDMLFNLMMRIRTIYIVSDSSVNLHEDLNSEEEVKNSSSSDEDNLPLNLVNGSIQKSQQFKQVELERAASVKSLPRSVYEEID